MPEPNKIPPPPPGYVPVTDDQNNPWGMGADSSPSQIGQFLKDTASGGYKSVMSGVQTLARPVKKLNAALGMPNLEKPDIDTTLHGAGEHIGAAAEQVGELALAGGPLKRAAVGIVSKLPPFLSRLAVPAARIVSDAALTSGDAALHGEDPKTAALIGGAGGAIAEGAQAIAPKIAESAIGIRTYDRLRGRTPGQTILNETSGVRPGTIAKQAGARAQQLTGELESAAQNAAAAPRASGGTNGALQVLNDAEQVARNRNSQAMLDKISQLRNQLTIDVTTGQPLNVTTPEQVLNLKRGVDELVNTWNPTEKKGFQPLVKRVYGALDAELDRTVPGADALNQQISSLIPVKRAAMMTAHSASIPQKISSRMAAHTGALAGTLAGGGYGYHKEGVPGAVKYGLAGLVLPELAASPTAQMIAARTMAAAPSLSPAAQGAILPLLKASHAQSQPQYAVGQTVNYSGKQYKIVGMKDGQAELEAVE